MNNRTKAILIGGLVGGAIFSVLMAVFDYADGQDFRPWRFAFNALFFGILMAVITRYSIKKESNKSE